MLTMFQLIACFRHETWHRVYLIDHNSRMYPHRLEGFSSDHRFCDNFKRSDFLCHPLPAQSGPKRLDSQSYKITFYGIIPVRDVIPLSENSNEPRIKSIKYLLYSMHVS